MRNGKFAHGLLKLLLAEVQVKSSLFHPRNLCALAKATLLIQKIAVGSLPVETTPEMASLSLNLNSAVPLVYCLTKKICFAIGLGSFLSAQPKDLDQNMSEIPQVAVTHNNSSTSKNQLTLEWVAPAIWLESLSLEKDSIKILAWLIIASLLYRQVVLIVNRVP